MADAENAEVQARFAPPNKPLEADVLAELRSMMRLHDLAAEDLYYKWDSYCIKLDLDAQDVSLRNVRGLKQSIQDDLDKSSHRQQAQPSVRGERKVNATPKAGSADVFGMLDGLVPSTPATGASKLNRGPGSATASAAKRRFDTPKGGAAPGSSPAGGMRDQLNSMHGVSISSFSDRTNPGEVVEILNDQLPAAEAPMAPYAEPRIKLAASSDQKKMAYRPLAMKLSEASEILDDRIDDFLALVQEHHGLDDSAFGNAAAQSTTDIVAVGRIASDSLEGKLNAASLVLETSRRTGMGFRVPLRTERIRAWSCFPGQIVALKGTNATDNEFVVSEVLEIPLLPNAASSAATLEGVKEKLRGGPDAMDSDAEPAPLSIIFAAGPYTADDNLDYEPLHALCSQAADSYADALVLTGPFLDADHPLIAMGDFDLPEDANHDPDTATMATVFRHLVAPAFTRLASANPHLTVVLVPSVRDILAKHVSWPQDTIPRKELGLPKAVRIVTNPMTLSVNELVLGVSSQDVLYELRAEELAPPKNAPAPAGGSPDLMSRLVRYLVEQRHYFPLWPAADRARLPKTGTEEGVATGAVLDVSYVKLGEMVNVRPDVMLVPSALPPFARVVESVLAINPGYLSKRRGAGTFARMTLHPPKTDGEHGDTMLSHRVFHRARVEIVRI